MSEKTWRDYIEPDEVYTILEELDDGSAVVLASYAGGANEKGEWGELTLMKLTADGETYFRHFEATEDWQDSGVTFGGVA